MNTAASLRGALALAAALAATAVCEAGAGPSRLPHVAIPYRLVYVTFPLNDDRDLGAIRSIVDRGARHGLNGVVLDAGFDRVDLQPPEWIVRLKKVRAICAAKGVALIPRVLSIGYGGGLLDHDRHLAAAVPVREAPFAVRAGLAEPEEEPEVRIVNGGFESHRGNRVTRSPRGDGIGFHDRPGITTFIDTVQHRTGHASLRFESFAANGRARVVAKVRVRPFRGYRITLWVRREMLDPGDAFEIQVLGTGSRVLMVRKPRLREERRWERVQVAFNSIDSRTVLIYAGVWRGRAGKFWVDDIRVEPAGLLDIVRRAGTPLVVRSDRGGRVYEEGVDFAVVHDPGLDYLADHAPPPIVIAADGRIREGERLRVSFYHALAFKQGQMGVCLSTPGVRALERRVVAMVDSLLSPDHYFLGADEWRHGGWCEACVSRGISTGEIFGRAIARETDVIRQVNPHAEVFVWSDMLDPNQNATDGYYLLNGGVVGSWRYIPGDLVVMCWDYDQRERSLIHFTGLGLRTAAAAYYDTGSLATTSGWLRALEKAPGACGIMYTTWRNQYGWLEAFGDLVAGDTRPGASGRN